MEGEALHSVVAPVFNEAQGLATFHERCTRSLDETGETYELLYVDDGSHDGSWEVLQDLAAEDSRVRLVRLSRNFGHQLAISAGLAHTRGDTVTVIDADLQDPPEVIAEMISRWREGADIVYAVRTHREGEGRFKRATAAAFYRVLRWFAEVEVPADAGDFRLMSRRAVAALLGMPEHDRYLRGMVAWIGYETATVDYTRDARFAGETKYPLAKMLRLALDGITGFSVRPLRLATWLGLIVSAAAFMLAVVLTILRILDTIEVVQGWTSLAVLILLVAGVQLVTVGALGEYIGRIYNEVRGRPLYLVRERQGFTDEEHRASAPGDERQVVVTAPGEGGPPGVDAHGHDRRG